MICPNCQTDNRDNAKFCDECGFDLRAAAPEAPTPAPSEPAEAALAAGAACAASPERACESAPVASPEPAFPDGCERAPETMELPTIELEPEQPDAGKESVAHEARAMFGMSMPKIDVPAAPTASPEPADADVTADFTGLERLVDSSYVPPTYSGRAGDTMELPRIEGEQAPQARAFIAQPDRAEARRQERAQRKLAKEQQRRERELAKEQHRRERDLQKSAPAPAGASTGAACAASSSALKIEQIAAEAKEISESQHPHTRRNRVIAIALGVVCALGLALGVTYYLQLWGGKVVPDVMSLSEQDARYVLEEKGFVVEVVEMKSDDIEGIALSTEPAAGSRAEEGASITLNISTARVIPDVVGKSHDEAVGLLDREKLAQVSFVTVKSNEEEGTVLSVSPEPGTKVKQNTAVTVEVAEPYTVPDVANMTTEQATEALKAEGYEVVTAWYRTEDIPEGTAVSTDPVAGTKLDSGSKVTLNIAHNRSTELISLTRSFFTDSPRLVIDGANYEMSEVTSVQYIGSNTCTFSIVARPYETHTWMFGLGSETRYGNYTTISGSISWDDDNNIVATTPVMKQGA